MDADFSMLTHRRDQSLTRSISDISLRSSITPLAQESVAELQPIIQNWGQQYGLQAMLAELRIAQKRDKEYIDQITIEKEEWEAYSRCIEELNQHKIECLTKRVQSVMKENKKLRDEVDQLSVEKKLNEKEHEKALQSMEQDQVTLDAKMKIKDERIKELEKMVEEKNSQIDSLLKLNHDIKEQNCEEKSCSPSHGRMGYRQKSLDFKLDQEIVRLQCKIHRLQEENIILKENMEKYESGKSIRVNWPQEPSISHNRLSISYDYGGYCSSYELSARIFPATDELEVPTTPVIHFEEECYDSFFENPMSPSVNRQKSRDTLLSVKRKIKKKGRKGKLNRTNSGIGKEGFNEVLKGWHQKEASSEM